MIANPAHWARLRSHEEDLSPFVAIRFVGESVRWGKSSRDLFLSSPLRRSSLEPDDLHPACCLGASDKAGDGGWIGVALGCEVGGSDDGDRDEESNIGTDGGRSSGISDPVSTESGTAEPGVVGVSSGEKPDLMGSSGAHECLLALLVPDEGSVPSLRSAPARIWR